MHKVIRALEGVASDIKFTSAATHDSFMLAPENFERGDLLALDRAYIDYGKFEELTKQGIVYVTKMKSGLTYKVVTIFSAPIMRPSGRGYTPPRLYCM